MKTMRKAFRWLLSVMLTAMGGYAASAAEYTAANQDEFVSVAGSAVSGDRILLGEGSFAIGPVDIDGKTLTFAGAGQAKTTVYIGNGGYDGNGGHGSNKSAKMTFEDLTLDDLASDSGYLTGFTEAAGLTFRNVTFGCGFSNWGNKGGAVSFYNCTFNPVAVSKYNVQELRSASGTQFLFDGCVFNSTEGRFINAYKQGGAEAFIGIVVKDCTFKNTGAAGKCALNLKDSANGCTIALTFVGENKTEGEFPALDESTKPSRLFATEGAGHVTVMLKATDDDDPVVIYASNRKISGTWIDPDGYRPISVVVAQVGETGYATLAEAIAAAIAANDGVAVELVADLDLTGASWTPVEYRGGKLTIDGKGFTVKGLSAGGLLKKTGSGGHVLTVRNITFDQADVTDVEPEYAAVICGYCDSMPSLAFENVTVRNSKVAGTKYAGAFVSYYAAYYAEDRMTFRNCTVENCTITGEGSVGAIVGHANGNVNGIVTVEGATITGNTITSTGDSKVKAGAVCGTVGSGAGMLVDATVSGNTVTSCGETITTVYGRQGATGTLTVTGGTYDAAPIAEADAAWAKPAEGYQVVKTADGKWTVGVKAAEETEAVITTKPQESKVEVDPQVGIDEAVVEKIEAGTKVEGVKLTAVAQGAKSGVASVVAAAKATDAAFAAAVEAAAEVSVKVTVEVRPTEYVVPAGETKGKVAFALTPKATVTVGEGDGAQSKEVAVSNAMIDQSHKIAVSIYTGFAPAAIGHYTESGALIENFGEGDIAYDETTGVATVMISHFSTLVAAENEEDMPEPVAAKIGETTYATVQEALNAAAAATDSAKTVVLQGDVTVAGGLTVTMTAKNVILDLNGKVLTSDIAVTAPADSTLTFTVKNAKGDPTTGKIVGDITVTNGKITISRSSTQDVTVEGSLVLNNVVDASIQGTVVQTDSTKAAITANGANTLVRITNTAVIDAAGDAVDAQGGTVKVLSDSSTGSSLVKGAIVKGEGANVAITGGVFGSDPSSVLSDNQVAVAQGTDPETWKVVKVVEAPAAVVGLVYNGNLQTGVVEGVGYVIAGNVATDAGDYTAEATPAAGFAWADGTAGASNIAWSIAKAGLKVKANDKSKFVGDDDPEFDYAITDGALVEGDALAGTLGWDGEETAGEHAIVQADDWVNPNYAVDFTPGTLTVNEYAATVNGEKFATIAEALAKVQALEAAGADAISVVAHGEQIVSFKGQSAKIADGETVTISPGSWTFDGALAYSGVIDGTVKAETVTIPDGGAITLAHGSKLITRTADLAVSGAEGVSVFKTTEDGYTVYQGMTPEEMPYAEELTALVTDAKGYYITDYIPHLKRTIVEMKVAVAAAKDNALCCASKYTAGQSTTTSIYAYGDYMQCYFTGDQDVSREVQGEDGIWVGYEDSYLNQPITVRASDNWLELYDAEGALIGRNESGTPDTDKLASGPLCLFAWAHGVKNKTGIEYGYRGSKTVYFVKVYEVDADDASVTNTVLDLIPVLTKDRSKVTLFDKVAQKELAISSGGVFAPVPYPAKYKVFNWTGASGADTKWSTAANWDGAVRPGPYDAAHFPAGQSEVEVDADSTTDNPLVRDFYALGSVKLTGGRTSYFDVSGLSEVATWGVFARGTLEASGAGTVANFQSKNTSGSSLGGGACLMASDGGKLVVEKVNFSDNANFKFVATNDGSVLSFTTATTGANLHSANKGLVFAAYDGGTVSSTSSPQFYKLDPTFVADGGTLDLGTFVMNQTGFTVTSTNGGSVKLGKIDNRNNAAKITCTDTSVITMSSSFSYPYSTSTVKSELNFSGKKPQIVLKAASTLGYNGTKDSLTINLKPEIAWNANGPLLDIVSAAKKITFYKGIKYNMDVTAFSNYYGRVGFLLSKASSSSNMVFNNPNNVITLTGGGAENCWAELSCPGKSLYVNVYAKNASSETAVAAVNNVEEGEQTVFFDSLEAAVAAAKDGAIIFVIKDVELTEPLVTTKSHIYLESLDPATIYGDIVSTEDHVIEVKSQVTNLVKFTIPAVAHTTAVVSNGEERLEAPYVAAPGANLTVTYTADEGYHFFESGETVKQVNVQAASGELATGVKSEDVAKVREDVATITSGGVTTGYATLAEAVDAAAAGQTVTLIADTTLTAAVQIGKKVTIDLATFTVTAAAGCNAIEVLVNGELTVNADSANPGHIVCESGKNCIYTDNAASAGNKSIVINNGIFDGACVFNEWGKAHTGETNPKLDVKIYGGTFNEEVTGYRCYYFWVYGGTFEKRCEVGTTSTCCARYHGGKFRVEPGSNNPGTIGVGDTDTTKGIRIYNAVYFDGEYYNVFNPDAPKAGEEEIVENAVAKVGTTCYYLSIEDALAHANSNFDGGGVQQDHRPLELQKAVDLTGLEQRKDVVIDPNGQTVTGETVPAEENCVVVKNSEGKIVVVDEADVVATIGEGTEKKNYLSLADAFAAVQDGETITLLKDVAGSGLYFKQATNAKSLTVDFGGFTYTCNTLVGDTGTVNQGMHLEGTGTFTFKNGTIKVDDSVAANARFVIQNYMNLVLDNMTIDGENLALTTATRTDVYALAVNVGEVTLTGGTTLKASTVDGMTAYALDCDDHSWGKADVVVNDAAITGDVSVEGGDLDLQSGTLDGAIVKTDDLGDSVIRKAETFEVATIPAGYAWNDGVLSPTFTITYVTDHGTTPEPKVVVATNVNGVWQYKLVAADVATPVCDEPQVFSGWYLGGTKVAAKKVITGDVTLTAKWAVAKVKFTNPSGTVSYQTSIPVNLVKGTYELLADASIGQLMFGSTLVKSGEIILDLGGHTVTTTSANKKNVCTRSDANGIVATIRNGKIVTTANSDGVAIWLGGNNSTITLAEDLEVVCANGSSVLIEGNGNTLNTAADITTTGGTFAIGTNGSTTKNATINVTGGSITSDNVAIYAPGEQALNISGGTITGTTAVEIRGGALNVTGGTLVATAEEYSVTPNGSGSTTRGAAVAVAQHTTELPLSVSIEGATLTGVKSVSVANPQGNDAENVEVTLGAATYNGALAFTADGNAAVAKNGAVIDAPADYKWDADGKLVAKVYVAQVEGGSKFETLAEAVAAAAENGTVTLLADCEGVGMTINKSVTIDFAGKTYTCVGPAAGSTGTKNQVFQLLKDNTVVLKGGTVKVADDVAGTFRFIIQNYANTTLDGMTLDASNVSYSDASRNDVYAMSCNSGEVAIKGGSELIAPTGENLDAFALDTSKNANYALPTVTVSGESKLTGDVSLSGGNLALESCTLTGELVETWEGVQDGVVTKAADIVATPPEGYLFNAEGILSKAFARIGEDCYASLAEAFAVATAEDTVTLIRDVAEAQTLENAKGTLDLNGFTITAESGTALKLTGATAFALTDSSEEQSGGLVGQTALQLVVGADDVSLAITGGTLEGNAALDVSKTKSMGAHGSCAAEISGGTFNGDVKAVDGYLNGAFTGGHFDRMPNALYVADGYQARQMADYAGRYEICIDWTAKVVGADGSLKGEYESLADAIAAAADGETVTLLKDAAGPGLYFKQATNAKSLTVDFGGCTYTCNTLVGDTGTVNQGMHLEGTGTFTFSNGVIRVDDSVADNARFVIQNYMNLVLDNMTIDGENLALTTATRTDVYALAANVGEVTLTGGTTLKASTVDGTTAYALDCDNHSWGKANVVVNDAALVGDVSVEGGDLDLQAGTLTGAIVKTDDLGDSVIRKAETFEVTAIPEDYVWAGEATKTLMMAVEAPAAVAGLVYNGTVQTGVVEGVGYVIAGNVATDAGDYTAEATLAAGFAWADGTVGASNIAWSIAKAGLEVKANDKSKFVGDDDPEFDYTITEGALVEGDVLAGTLGWDGEETAGEHAIVQANDWVNPNYEVVFTAGTLTVKEYAAAVNGEKFATAEEALAKVQALEAEAQSITIVVRGEQTVSFGGQTATLADGETVTISAGSWTFDGAFGYSGVIDGTVKAETVEIPDGGAITLTLGAKLITKSTGLALTGAEGVAIDVTTDGDYTVYTGATSVAQIGEVGYASLEDAIAAVGEGETVTVTLLEDITTADEITVGVNAAITLDTNGKTLEFTDGAAALVVSGGTDLTIVGDGEIVNHAENYEDGGYAVVVDSADAALTLDGATLDGMWSGVSVKAGAYTQVSGKVIGYEAIEIDGDGSEAPIDVSIEGGLVETTDTVNGEAVMVDSGYIADENFSVLISGGEFKGVIDSSDPYDLAGAISGGKFSAAVADGFLAEGFELVDTGAGEYPYVVASAEPAYVFVTSIAKSTNDVVTLVWEPSESGQYQIEYADALGESAVWDTDGTWIQATTTVTLPNQTAPVRFYRVRTLTGVSAD